MENMFKKVVLATAVASLDIAPTSVSALGQKSMAAKPSANVTQQVTLSDEQIASLKAEADIQTPISRPSSLLDTVSSNFKYTNLHANGSVNTYEWYTTTNPAGEDVVVKLVQYPSSGWSGTCNAIYSLRGGPYVQPISLKGNWTSTNTSIVFHNVMPGTYYLNIANVGTIDQDGNGFVYYY